MGNCQAIDAAALVIQHPDGRMERFYWPLTASEVMRHNPGHYVSLIIPLPVSNQENYNQNQNQNQHQDEKTVRFTRVKLLRPSDILDLGHAYRLITSQEVMKVVQARKYANTKRQQTNREDKLRTLPEKQSSSRGNELDAAKNNQERNCPRTASMNSASTRPKTWRPSLKSISETAS